MPTTLLDTFLYALVALLVILDPAGTAAVFAAMTPNDSPAERASQARRACIIAFVVLALFGIAGEQLLTTMGISLAALRIAGGVLLFLTAADMVTARGALRQTGAEREAAMRTEDDIAVFPLAIPLIAGPGAMTTMVLLHSQASHASLRIAVVELALACAIGAVLIALLAARHVARLLGESGAGVIGRVLGVLLAALAVQIALQGIKEAMAH